METNNQICIPIEIIRNHHISPRARIVWAELSALPRGQVGEFVVKQKELARLMGVCVSTLRRAIAALEAAKLIQCVGLWDKRYKKYVFTMVQDKIPSECPETSQQPDVKEKKKPIEQQFKSPFVYGKNCRIPPLPTGPDAPKEVLLRMEFNFFDTTKTKMDLENLRSADTVYMGIRDSLHSSHPLLNGKDGRPMLDLGMIHYLLVKAGRQYFAATGENLNPFRILDILEKGFPDMILGWVDVNDIMP